MAENLTKFGNGNLIVTELVSNKIILLNIYFSQSFVVQKLDIRKSALDASQQ